jgi:hypothetical protein
MRSLVSEELLPYYDEYKRLLTTIREDQELMGQNEDFIEDYMRDADVDPTEDSTIRIFTDGITNANDSINDCSARLDEIDKTIVESGLVGSIYKSRLNKERMIVGALGYFCFFAGIARDAAYICLGFIYIFIAIKLFKILL